MYSSETLEKVTNYELALRRKLDELIWMDYFLRYQIDYLEPQRVIQNFFTHQKLQADIINNMILPSENEINIGGDFEVIGNIEIISSNLRNKIQINTGKKKDNEEEYRRKSEYMES